MNILFLLYDRTEANSFYRSGGIASDLALLTGHKITVERWNEYEVQWQTLLQYDVLFLQRPFTDKALGVLRYAKSLGLKVWVDFDDNLLNVSPENKNFVFYSKQDTKKTIMQILVEADAVSVTTLSLKQNFEYIRKDIWVIPNAFNDKIKRSVKKREKTVFWRGTDSHIFNLMSHGDQINSLIENNPDYKFLFMGYYPWFIHAKKEYTDPQDILLYFEKIQELAPSVVHVPINSDPFNCCRSPIAFIEASFAGAITVCPHWWDVHGALKYKDAQEYHDNIQSVLKGDVDVEKYSRMSWEYVEDCLMLSKVNQKRKLLLESL